MVFRILFSCCLFFSSLFAEAQFIPAGEPVPILEYRFNETGIFAPSSGTDQVTLTLRTNNSSPFDMHSEEGSGVSGRKGDRSFDNSASTTRSGGVADGLPSESISGLKSMTLLGWLKSKADPLTFAPRVIESWSGPYLGGRNPGRLVFNANTNETGATSDAYFGEIGEWFFFAVTFDGTTNTNNIHFYKGLTTSNVTLVGIFSATPGLAPSSVPYLKIGNTDTEGANRRPFVGWIDNIRIFGSKTDSGGVLNQTQLELLRTKDVLNFSDDIRLSVSRNNNEILIRWPADPDAFALEYTTNLNSPTSWQPVEVVPTVTGDQKVVNWPATSTHFFRLRAAIP